MFKFLNIWGSAEDGDGTANSAKEAPSGRLLQKPGQQRIAYRYKATTSETQASNAASDIRNGHNGASTPAVRSAPIRSAHATTSATSSTAAPRGTLHKPSSHDEALTERRRHVFDRLATPKHSGAHHRCSRCTPERLLLKRRVNSDGEEIDSSEDDEHDEHSPPHSHSHDHQHRHEPYHAHSSLFATFSTPKTAEAGVLRKPNAGVTKRVEARTPPDTRPIVSAGEVEHTHDRVERGRLTRTRRATPPPTQSAPPSTPPPAVRTTTTTTKVAVTAPHTGAKPSTPSIASNDFKSTARHDAELAALRAELDAERNLQADLRARITMLESRDKQHSFEDAILASPNSEQIRRHMLILEGQAATAISALHRERDEFVRRERALMEQVRRAQPTPQETHSRAQMQMELREITSELERLRGDYDSLLSALRAATAEEPLVADALARHDVFLT